MDDQNGIRIIFITFFSAVTGLLGTLAIPVYVLVLCNLIDYTTGIMATKARNKALSVEIGMKGIFKKVAQWLLVCIGYLLDLIVMHTATIFVGSSFKEPYMIAIVVALWLVFNEMLSILKNLNDIGAPIPPFFEPIIKKFQTSTENTAEKIIKDGVSDE